MILPSFTRCTYTAILTWSDVTQLDSSSPKLKDDSHILRFDTELALLEAFVSQVVKRS